MSKSTNGSLIADARPDNWVDRFAPAFMKPYLKLARFDRPIGAWLLLFPCWWGQGLAELQAGHEALNLWYLLLFAIGAFVMRGAGCTWNDIIDRDYDARVARTALRPIPSGQVTARQAFLFAICLSLSGFLVLIQFNIFTIWLGIASLGLVAVYPFSKRFTYWPQIVLGLTFNWGALVGWAAIHGEFSLVSLLLYAGCVCWTIGYDTIYAHQDKEDDALLGLKSTALHFGAHTQYWLILFYGASIALWLAAALIAGADPLLYLAIIVISGHFVWQIITLDTENSGNCLARFKSNSTVGWLFFLGLLSDIVLR